MRIESFTVENFRCVLDARIPMDPVTALVGRNGSGKSAFLRALHIFYTAGAAVTEEDFYNRGTDGPVVIEVTWGGLTEAERVAYGAYVDGDTLTVRKEISWVNGRPQERYYGSRMQYEGFRQVRAPEGAREKRTRFNELVEAQEIPGIGGRAPSAAEVERRMQEWEEQHPELCVRLRDDGQFFGFRNVGVGKLERFTRFVHVPAVRDASEDATEGRDSPLTELVEMIVRNVLRENRELEEFRDDVQRRYSELVSPESLPQLPELSRRLTDTLQQYVSNAEVSLLWERTEGPEILLPRALAALTEDGYAGEVSRKGHGLQRAFILSLMQFLAAVQVPVPEELPESTEDSGLQATAPMVPSLVLAIEEPELYQHPNRQRHLARVFHSLVETQAPTGGPPTQVLYTTHSPYFVDVASFDEIRLVRKRHNDEDPALPMVSEVVWATLEDVVRHLEQASQAPPGSFSVEALKGRMLAVMTPLISEGFFADAVVLVEGENDRAAVLAAAEIAGVNLEDLGISVLPVLGKNNLDRPWCVFSQLEIPCHMVFDGDRDKGPEGGHPETNMRLLRLVAAEPQEFPPCQSREEFTCFEDNLTERLARDLGEEQFRASCERSAERLGYDSAEDVRKCPAAVRDVLAEAAEGGRTCEVLSSIVEKARSLCASRGNTNGK